PGAGQHTLSTNFRSTQPIVEASGSFAHQELGAQRLPKTPVAERNPAPRHLGIHHFPTRPDEARWVADRIQALLGTEYIERNGTRRGLTPADFAILMSSTKSPEQDGNPRHHAFSSELQSRNVPYTLAAGGSVFDRAQVAALRDVFALFRGGNPDRTASIHVFNTSLLPAFPAADQGQVLQVISVWGRKIHAPTGTTRSRLYPQILLMDLLEALGVKNDFPPDEVMREIGLFSRMLQDVESVYMSVDSAYRFQDVINFLDNVAEDGYNLSTEDVTTRPDAVTISTVHQMKGLEFPVVFVVDVEPGRFPNANRRYAGLIPIDMIAAAIRGGAYQGSSFSQARLFYTALTRAERYLYVSGCATLPGGKRVYPPSPFANRLVHPELVSDQTQLPPGLVPAPPVTRSDDSTLPTSFSDVKYYLKCPMDYRFRKSFGFSPEIAELFGYGRVVHVAIEKLHEEFLTTTPTQADARRVVQENFHLKHVAPSRSGNPGPYERAQNKAEEIAVEYVTRFADDFSHRRQVEARFEIPADHCLITGAIDLMLHEDDHGAVIESQVLDFKTMEGGKDPEHNPDLDWTELSLQVQLYAKAAREVLQEPATAGAIHLLKDNQRIAIPVDDEAVEIAVENVVWAVAGILARDFPMRPEPTKCQACDFKRICPQLRAEFRAGINTPRALKTPDGERPAACLLI
ncbi:MAG TPA: ATP-dependent DNA helicase, partial [Candidatus Cloacimonadota bacterium]|nr:ATP-dependent DNA helicase [Candidatus Cloacimonadota bacterium]